MSSKQLVNGILLLNKPSGLSSNQALQKVKNIYKAKKAGHTGTLDPLATGLLPICFGEATKFASIVLDSDKEYIATIKLGLTTTTYDSEGDVVATHKVCSTQEEISRMVMDFLGKIEQVPPIYSALKLNGKPLYKYARNQEEITIKSRIVNILELEVLDYLSVDTFRLRVLCSKGTYIRSLAHDIGVRLGCGGHLSGLIRTKTGGFVLKDGYTLEELTEQNQDITLLNRLLPIDSAIINMDIINIDEQQYLYIKNGHEFLSTAKLVPGSSYRIYYNENFLGVVMAIDDYLLRPQRLLNQGNIIL